MNTAKIIKYKTCLDIIHTYTLRDGARLSKSDLDLALKTGADVNGSTTEMTSDELNGLIEYTYLFADGIGCELKEKDSEKIKLNFNRE